MGFGGTMRGTLLVMDPDSEGSARLAATLRQEGHDVERETSPDAALRHATQPELEVVVAAFDGSAADADDFVSRLASSRPDVPVVLVAQRQHLLGAARAVRAHAYDLVLSPVEPELLLLAVERALRHHRLVAEVTRLRTQSTPPSANTFHVSGPVAVDGLVPADEVERRYVLHVLAAVKGNKSRAARVLGFDRRTLYRKLEKNAEIESRGEMPTEGAA
jgi:DNA-binding NtrC family response regulator